MFPENKVNVNQIIQAEVDEAVSQAIAWIANSPKVKLDEDFWDDVPLPIHQRICEILEA